MNKIIDVKLPRDYDFQRIPAPWIQIKILQIFEIIWGKDKKLSEEIYNVVEKTLRRSDDTMNDIGFAVTFQAIRTITQLYSNQTLLEKASKTVGKFFMTLPENVKLNKVNLIFLGIESMRSLVNINPNYASKHQYYIVDCLQHPDESIRRPTLDILYKTTNSSNLDVVMEKMLNFLKSTNEVHFKNDLVVKIYELNERLAPDTNWFVSKTNMLFEYGDEWINDSMLSRTIKIIEENLEMDTTGEFGSLLLSSYYEYLGKPVPYQLVKLICWIFSEVGSRHYSDDTTSLDQLISSVESMLHIRTIENTNAKCWIISSLAKLSSCEGFKSHDKLKHIYTQVKQSNDPELRERAFLFQKCNAGIQTINKIENYDWNLSFLKTSIENALNIGLPKYDPNKLTSALISLAKNESQSGELLTQHREVKVDKTKLGDEKLNSNNKKIFIVPGSENKEFKKPENLNFLENETLKKIQKEKETEEASKQIQVKNAKIAKQLFGKVEEENLGFGSLSNNNTKKAIFKKPKTKTNESEQDKPVQGGNIAPVESNILDLDDNSVKQTASLGDDLDLLGGTSPQKAGLPGFPTANDSNKPKFNKPKFKAPTTLNAAPKKLTPFLVMTEEEYEMHHSSWGIDKEETLKNTSVRTQTDFNQLTSALGFHITKSLGTDNIWAAKLGESMVLFYGKYKLNGELKVMLYSDSQDAIDFAAAEIRKYWSK